MSRALRVSASALAILSLAMLGRESFRSLPDHSSPTTDVTLWTAGVSTTGRTADNPRIHVALPDAHAFPDNASRVPDVAYLRWAFPKLRRLIIEGDGIDESEGAVLRGLDVTWRRPAAGPLRTPELVSVSAPREIPVGQRMQVQGRIRGVRLGEELPLMLEGPDGSKPTMIMPTASDGDLAFQITDESAAVAPGAFEWKLRLGPKGEPLVFGAVVTLPQHPRVLILQSSPAVEGARLQRWLAESGVPVLTRTRVSADHFRFSSANGPADEYARLDSAVLAKFDVVITHDPALGELAETERTALETALRDTGLGLLIIGDYDGTSSSPLFTPWQLQRITGADETDDRRMSRVRLRDGTELGELASVLPAEFVAFHSARWLARDPHDRILVAAFPRGRGWLARSLVTDTWRWLQSDRSEIFATFWSNLLSAVARRGTMEGQWTLDHGSGPIFDGDPLKLSWSCAPDVALSHAQIRFVGDANDALVPVELVRDATEPTRARAVFYPTRHGWHEVRILPNGPLFAFHIQSRETLPELRAERRRDVTARLVARASELPRGPESEDARSSPPFLSDWLWLALFVVSIGALWWGERK